MSTEMAQQAIPISKELAAQLQRLSAKFQSFDLTYIELREQVECITKSLLARINALEAEKAKLEKTNNTERQ